MPLTRVRIGRLFNTDPMFTTQFIRLMAAADDFNTAISSFERLPKPASRTTELRFNGQRLYYLRLACGHLDEANQIIKQLQNDFSELLVQGPPNLAEAYMKIAATISPLEEMLTRLRNNALFHHEDAELTEALQEWGPDGEGVIVTGEGLDDTRYSVADEAVSQAIRRIFGFPGDIEENRRAFEDLTDQLTSLRTDLLDYVHWLLDAVGELFPETVEAL
ncbi:MAG: hypothetical protein ACE5G5_01110 [Candidatus Methylomirabilales bacterium]